MNKTHYGINIYSHILREYYPDEVVMTITGRDCGLCRNPFNSNKETLHIWISKTDPTNVMSSEVSCHEDMQNAIPTSFDMNAKVNGYGSDAGTAGTSIIQNISVISPKALSEKEIAREFKNLSRKLALEY